jgi:hypothetical protein
MALTTGFSAEELRVRILDKLENGGIKDKLKVIFEQTSLN